MPEFYPLLMLLCGFAGFFMITTYVTDFKYFPKIENSIGLLIFMGLFTRLLAACIDASFPSDIATFKYWSEYLSNYGLGTLYSNNGLSDYPPVYMYVLYFVGHIKNALGIESEYLYTLLIKLPGIIFDLLCAGLIYKIALNKCKPNTAWLLGLFYVLNPAVILDSAVWGQVDSVHTFFLLWSVYMLTKESYAKSYGLFALGILIKPQSLILSPIYLYSAYSLFKENGVNKNTMLQFLKALAVAALTAFVVMLPFTKGLNFAPIIKQYIGTLESYGYATVNAYNLYALFGGNWVSVDTTVLFLPLYIWGGLFIVGITILSFFLLHRSREKSNYFFVAALLYVLTFMLSVKMHERYFFPAMAFLLAAFAYRRDRRFQFLYGGLSLTFFINLMDIMLLYMTNATTSVIKLSMPIVSFLNLLLTGFMVYTGFMAYKEGSLDEEDLSLGEKPSPYHWTDDFRIQKSAAPVKMEKLDFLIIAGITLVYSIVAFINLGGFSAPQTLWTANSGDQVVFDVVNAAGTEDNFIFDLGDERYIHRVQYFVGPRAGESFTLEVSKDGEFWIAADKITTKGVFSWREAPVEMYGSYIRLTVEDGPLGIFEMAFRDEKDNLIPLGHSGTEDFLFDEQDTVPFSGTYMNGTYFDEIYHARTAYEYLNQLEVYETTHPPLGKVFISLGIAIFGMNPFGWRVIGVLFGIFMVPLMYVFGKKVLKTSFWAGFTAIIFSFDFMHFTQTRIATIDTYTTFFIMAAYFFMYLYIQMNFYDKKLRETFVPLGLSGISMGLAAACKWQGVYAGVGLGVLFFMSLYRRFKEYRFAKLVVLAEEPTEYHHIILSFGKNTIKTIGFCLIFFVAMPVMIYAASYILYMRVPGFGGLQGIINNQLSMWNYHSKLESSHSYASPWWQWPLMIRPVFYYAHDYGETLKAGISAFGNPAVWWTGIPAFFYAIRHYSKGGKGSKTALFLIIAYLAQFLPWMLISRTTYIYHYFPSVPFITLMIGLMFKEVVDKKSRKLTLLYVGAVILLFILFYPVLSGMPVSTWYVGNILRWFPTWQLILG